MGKQEVAVQAHIKTEDGMRMYRMTYRVSGDEAHSLRLPIDTYGKSYVQVQLRPIKAKKPPTNLV